MVSGNFDGCCPLPSPLLTNRMERESSHFSSRSSGILFNFLLSLFKVIFYSLQVRNEFSKLFQFKAIYLLEELISPLITPFILILLLRPKALEIVDFLRHFTVEVVGVGDVCSFAQLDIHKHGQPQWRTSISSEGKSIESVKQEEEVNNLFEQSENII